MSLSSSELVPVVASVVRDQDRVLICQRPAEKRHGGLWEFPGGKLQDGEGFLEAARRELSEELHLDVVSTGPLLSSIPDTGGVFVIHFVDTEVEGTHELREHQATRWVTIAELSGVKLAPADRAFAVYLAKCSADEEGQGTGSSSNLTGPTEAVVWSAVAAAAEAWGTNVHDLALRYEGSFRMTRSLGRCYPKRRLIRINTALLDPRFSSELAEIAVHEAAHVVARDRYGAEARPHGPEWKELLLQAGYKPRIRMVIDIPELTKVRRAPGSRRNVIYEHKCPVCQTSRVAARSMKRWRCAACLEAGLSGELGIVTLSTHSI